MPAGDSQSRGMDMLLRGRGVRKPEPRVPDPRPEPEGLELAPTTRPSPAPLCVRIPAAAKMLGIGRTKVYQLINRGELEIIKLDDSVLIPVRSLEAFVARHSVARKRSDEAGSG